MGSMDFLQSYFPTPKLQRVELRWHALLDRELARLRLLPGSGVVARNLVGQLDAVGAFCSSYHLLYMDYLAAVLPQHREPVRCGAGCGNCCHHFPMSVEPFELLFLYMELRQRADFVDDLEACVRRTRQFGQLRRELGDESGDEAEEALLHRYFASGLACPFIREGGNCGIYDHRPLTCRMYFSHTDPQYCVPEHLQTPLNRSFIVYLPDEIEEKIAEISAFYAELELPEGLYSGLLALNAFEGCFSDGR